jgi:hypothetical protein
MYQRQKAAVRTCRGLEVGDEGKHDHLLFVVGVGLLLE